MKNFDNKDKCIKLRVGLRTIKTVIAVFICLMIEMLRLYKGVPFYAVIASVLCMQRDRENSLKAGINREIATIIGGTLGMLFLIIEDYFPLRDIDFFRAIALSLMIIPIMLIITNIKRSTAAYITCVVFYSVTISHVGDVSKVAFALNRMLDTTIGITVSLLVNRIPFEKIRPN